MLSCCIFFIFQNICESGKGIEENTNKLSMEVEKWWQENCLDQMEEYL